MVFLCCEACNLEAAPIDWVLVIIDPIEVKSENNLFTYQTMPWAPVPRADSSIYRDGTMNSVSPKV